MHAFEPLVLFFVRKEDFWLSPVFESLAEAQRAAVPTPQPRGPSALAAVLPLKLALRWDADFETL